MSEPLWIGWLASAAPTLGWNLWPSSNAALKQNPPALALASDAEGLGKIGTDACSPETMR